MQDNPTVSVVTSAYNCAPYIEANVQSVARQTYPVLEHIIVDDGSSDNTWELLEELQKEHAHIRIIRQRNQGAGVARNVAIEQSRGRYIAFLDDDDFWLESKLEAQIGFMQATECIFSYGDYFVLGETQGRIYRIKSSPEKADYATFLSGCPIGCLTVAYDQEATGKIYMPLHRRGQDWGLWLALTRNGTVARKYPGVHAVYRKRRQSLHAKKLCVLADVYRIYIDQEELDVFRTAVYLCRHVYSTLKGRIAY